MKTIITLLLFIMTMNSKADTAFYNVKEGKLHKGGNLQVKVLDTLQTFTVHLNYEIVKKGWVPVPSEFLKGDMTTNLPEQFKDERGYLELETVGTMKVDKATLKFVKRMNYGALKDAFLIEILSDNKKSKTTVIYHPELPAVGWAKVEITFMSDIGLLDGYQIIAELK